MFVQYVWPPTAFKNPLIVGGLIVTVAMAVCAQVLGVILGVVGALGQMSRFRGVRWAVMTYLIYFRGTPALIQLSLLYFGLASIGLYRFPDIEMFGFVIPGVFQAGILGLGLNEGAFMTEIIRAGILSVDSGQTDAAKALGMTFPKIMRWIVLPQAAKTIVPPLGNEFNAMIKSTTLVVVIGGVELFNSFEQVNAVLFRPFELFLAVSCYYLAMTIAWGFVQSFIELRLGDARPNLRPKGIARILGKSRAMTVAQGEH